MGKQINHLLLTISAIIVALTLGSAAHADDNDQGQEGPSLSQPQYFNSSSAQDFSSDTNSPASAAAQKMQTIPSHTAIPTEGVRWPHRKI